MKNKLLSIKRIISFITIVLSACNADDLNLGNTSTSKNLVSISGKSTGTAKIGELDSFTIDLTNDGKTEITINDIDFSQNDEGAFSFENGKPVFPLKIQEGKKHSIKLKFTPTKVKTYTAILAVTGNDPSDTKTYTLKFSGTLASSSIKSSPSIGVYTGCDYPKAIRDLTDINNSLKTDYITNHFKLRVISIDSINERISFEVMRCDNLNFKKHATVSVYEENPTLSWYSVSVYVSPNDPLCKLDYDIKFQGHDVKRFIATITESDLDSKYYCTKEITLTW